MKWENWNVSSAHWHFFNHVVTIIILNINPILLNNTCSVQVMHRLFWIPLRPKILAYLFHTYVLNHFPKCYHMPGRWSCRRLEIWFHAWVKTSPPDMVCVRPRSQNQVFSTIVMNSFLFGVISCWKLCWWPYQFIPSFFLSLQTWGERHWIWWPFTPRKHTAP